MPVARDIPMSSRSSSADEKHNATKTEYVDEAVHDPDFDLSEEEKRRIDKALLRKLDLKLIPWVSWPLRLPQSRYITNARLSSLLFCTSSLSSTEPILVSRDETLEAIAYI